MSPGVLVVLLQAGWSRGKVIVSGRERGFVPDRSPASCSCERSATAALKREERQLKPYSFLFFSPRWHDRGGRARSQKTEKRWWTNLSLSLSLSLPLGAPRKFRLYSMVRFHHRQMRERRDAICCTMNDAFRTDGADTVTLWCGTASLHSLTQNDPVL